MKYKVVITDLDGTLFNDKYKISNKDFNTLKELGKNKIIRIIATGRSLHSFTNIIPYNFPIDYLIFSNGGGIFNFNTKVIIKNLYIKKKDVKFIASKLLSLKFDFQIREKIPYGHKYIYKRFFKYNPDFDKLNKKYAKFISPLCEVKNLKEASRIITISPELNLSNILSNEFKNFTIIRATSPIDKKSIWTEIYPKGVHKGQAVSDLCEMLKIHLSETIGIGNDYNDIDFLNITGKSFMVENAPNELKKNYIITNNNNNNPLSKVIETVNLI